MSLTTRLKAAIGNLAKRYGYRIERIVDYGEHQLDVFRLLVNQLDPADPDFFFVQVGAHDGKTSDPIHQFVKHFRWRGLLIEPQPEVYTTLIENYADQGQLIFENAAIAPNDGVRSLYTVKGSSYLASFDRKTLINRVRDQSRIVEVPVKTSTFDTLAKRHAIQRIDLLLVDTEGFDYEVIKMAFGALCHPRLIRYEHLHLCSGDRVACAELLASQGYKLHRDRIDTIAFYQPSGTCSNQLDSIEQ